MNVKQGDLAIIVRASNAGDALGRIVRVGEWKGIEWAIEFVGDPPPSLARYKTFTAPDFCLRTISGLPDTESTDEQLIKPVANLVSAD